MKYVSSAALLFLCFVISETCRAGIDGGWASYNKGGYASAIKESRPFAAQRNVSDAAATWYFNAAEQFAENAGHLNVSVMPIPAPVLQQGKLIHAPGVEHAFHSGKIFHDCSGCPEMVVIPTGSFDMGSPGSETGRSRDEGPVHRVSIAAFALGKTEITRGQFAAFVKETKYSTGEKCWTLDSGKFKERSGNWHKPGYVQDNKHPVTCINWNDAQAYTQWLSRKTGKKYRLPTEAEWEYSARGNTSTVHYWGDSPDEACGYADVADKTAQAQIHGASSWSVHNCTDGFTYTAPAGSFKANTFGLNDMLGNVWEWTKDSYHDNYNDAPSDGSAWQGDGAKRVLRGGSWNSSPRDVRTAIRDSNNPERRFSVFGFRVARVLP